MFIINLISYCPKVSIFGDQLKKLVEFTSRRRIKPNTLNLHL